jgi:biopolymer transport protein ExbD
MKRLATGALLLASAGALLAQDGQVPALPEVRKAIPAETIPLGVSEASPAASMPPPALVPQPAPASKNNDGDIRITPSVQSGEDAAKSGLILANAVYARTMYDLAVPQYEKFLMMTLNFARNEAELDVKVPSAHEGKEAHPPVGEVILDVKKDGSIVMNRRTMTSDELKQTLTRLAGLYPDQAIVLRGDENVDYSHVVNVLDICRAANIWNVAFATSKPE